jgi:hypothetical protein
MRLLQRRLKDRGHLPPISRGFLPAILRGEAKAVGQAFVELDREHFAAGVAGLGASPAVDLLCHGAQLDGHAGRAGLLDREAKIPGGQGQRERVVVVKAAGPGPDMASAVARAVPADPSRSPSTG